MPQSLRNTIASYPSIYVRLSDVTRDPLKVSQETSRTHSKDVCAVGNSRPFCLSGLLSMSVFLSFRLHLGLHCFSLFLSSFMYIYSSLRSHRQPVFPPSLFPLPHSCSLHMGLVCCASNSTLPEPITARPSSAASASHFPHFRFLREECSLGT